MNDAHVLERMSKLAEQGGACEHLAKLFAYKRGMAEGGFPCPPLSETPWTDALTQLLARIAELEGELAKRDEALTIAYRLWLQGHHEEVGDYLLPFSTDFKRKGGEG